MRRLGRILRRVLTALSLLLMVGVCGVWVRGYWSRDIFTLERESRDEREWRWSECGVQWGRGELGFGMLRSQTDAEQVRRFGIKFGSEYRILRSRDDPVPVRPHWIPFINLYSRIDYYWSWSYAGIGIQREYRSGPVQTSGLLDGQEVTMMGLNQSYLLSLPCYLPALLFALLPSQRLYVTIRRRRKARRAARGAQQGLCPHCHYDLRATPDPTGPRLSVCPECGRKV